MNNRITPELIESFAEFLRAEKPKSVLPENEEIFVRLENISQRLAVLEKYISSENNSFESRKSYKNHPSTEKFAVGFAVSENSPDAATDKICVYEPLPKLCDNCSMCSSRGF